MSHSTLDSRAQLMFRRKFWLSWRTENASKNSRKHFKVLRQITSVFSLWYRSAAKRSRYEWKTPCGAMCEMCMTCFGQEFLSTKWNGNGMGVLGSVWRADVRRSELVSALWICRLRDCCVAMARPGRGHVFARAPTQVWRRPFLCYRMLRHASDSRRLLLSPYLLYRTAIAHPWMLASKFHVFLRYQSLLASQWLQSRQPGRSLAWRRTRRRTRRSWRRRR
jgi:hypothetical protein